MVALEDKFFRSDFCLPTCNSLLAQAYCHARGIYADASPFHPILRTCYWEVPQTTPSLQLLSVNHGSEQGGVAAKPLWGIAYRLWPAKRRRGSRVR
jgi:hypothetical protein